MKRYESWGRFPRAKHAAIIPLYWRSDPPCFDELAHPVLPFAYGRSYGDACLNDGGILIDTAPLSRFMGFDEENGVIRCEAGMTLAEILDLAVPRGWFLPVTPGTKYVSIGGAIANDVHGKNHHNAGTFGRYVKKFELLRSTGDRFLCSPSQNVEYYNATIGGLGLTGLILWAEVQLIPIGSPYVAMERIRFADLREFLDLSASSDHDYRYTAAWVDCLVQGADLGRGIFIRGNHLDRSSHAFTEVRPPRTMRVPCEFPGLFLNWLTIKAFNTAYYYAQFHKHVEKVVHYEPFFYPLDAIQGWNQMYGRRGLLQYQCVVPYEAEGIAIREILTRIARSRKASFLGVLKIFGNHRSSGMLSFPRPGITLALDFPYDGFTTLQLLEELDGIVREARGAVYPAKDARMSAKSFQTYFPNWREFSRFIDPKFSSSLWRRVTGEIDENEACTKS